MCEIAEDFQKGKLFNLCKKAEINTKVKVPALIHAVVKKIFIQLNSFCDPISGIFSGSSRNEQ